jgi:hypothetical protein
MQLTLKGRGRRKASRVRSTAFQSAAGILLGESEMNNLLAINELTELLTSSPHNRNRGKVQLLRPFNISNCFYPPRFSHRNGADFKLENN